MEECNCNHKMELDGNADTLIMIDGYFRYLTELYIQVEERFACPMCNGSIYDIICR